MYSKHQLAVKWIRYYIRAANSRGHGIHSPFVYELIREVFNNSRNYYAYEGIEKEKSRLKQDTRSIPVKDFGTGSTKRSDASKPVADIAGTAVSGQKFGRLLFRLANYYQATNIVELGSSLGISTAYLASANPSSSVITLEGSDSVAAIASETFLHLKLDNIKQITGSFEANLPMIMSPLAPYDLVFIDGNHRKQPVLDYFEFFLDKISFSSLIIIHDIHYSGEMEEAWKLIQQHPSVKMAIDIFSAGLIFFRKEFQIKQSFAIRF